MLLDEVLCVVYSHGSFQALPVVQSIVVHTHCIVTAECFKATENTFGKLALITKYQRPHIAEIIRPENRARHPTFQVQAVLVGQCRSSHATLVEEEPFLVWIFQKSRHILSHGMRITNWCRQIVF